MDAEPGLPLGKLNCKVLVVEAPVVSDETDMELPVLVRLKVAPFATTSPPRYTVNSGPLVGNVPGPAGVTFLPTIEPAMATAGTIIRKRPASMTSARVTFQ